MRPMTPDAVPQTTLDARPIDAAGRTLRATAGQRGPCRHWAPNSDWVAELCPRCGADAPPDTTVEEVGWTTAPVQIVDPISVVPADARAA